jgi:hypothetical protein
MPRPIAGEEALAPPIRPSWRLQLLRLGLLLFLLVFAVPWVVGVVFAVDVLWHHHSPTTDAFLGGWLLIWASVPVVCVAPFIRGTHIRPHRPGSPSWSAVFFVGGFAVAWFAGLAALLSQGDTGGFLVMAAFTAIVLLIVITGELYRENVTIGPRTTVISKQIGPFHWTRHEPRAICDPRVVAEIGLVPTLEGFPRFALEGVGTLRVEGDWHGASATANGAHWRFAGSGLWSLRWNATAAGEPAGAYRHRARALRWGHRELRLRRGSLWRKFGWRAPFAGRTRYVLSEGGRTLAEIEENMRWAHRPINIEAHDPGALEPGLLLFVVFLAGWLDMRDRNNDGA